MDLGKNQARMPGTLKVGALGKDFWAGLIFLLISLLFYFVIIPRQVEGEIQRGLAPNFFPNFAAIWIGFFGICISIKALGSRGKISPRKESIMLSQQRVKGAVSAMVLCVFYVIICSFVGYIISSVLFLGLFIWNLGERRWYIIAIAAVATTFGIYVLFGMVMSLRLPEGIFISL